jgi:peptidoglycan/LPS O-acetylase OafA/YrhL
VLPALLLGYLFDHAGIMVTTGGPEVYPPPVRAAHAPSVLLCNAVFLQTIRCAPAGSNVALWSLANEFWYYVLWPLLLAPWLVRRPRRERAALLALGVGIAAWLTTAEHSGALFVLYMVVWLIGVVPFVVRGPWFGTTPRRTALLFVALLIAIRIGVRLDLEADPWRVFALDLGVALAFANVLASLRSDHVTRLLPGSAWHRAAAEFSYSLYAVHVPIVTFASALLASRFGIGWHMPPSGVLVYVLSVGYVAGAIVCGWAFARVTEAHTTAVRRRVARLLARRPSR